MSGLKNSPFGKRLRAAHQDTDDETPRRNRQRVNPAFALTPPAVAHVSIPSLNYSQLTASDTPGPESPEHPSRAHREYGDRFVPSRDTGDMRTSYHLMDDSGPSTPSKHRTIPTESDAIKEQANAIFNSILHSEVTPPSPCRPASPTRPIQPPASIAPTTPTRRRIFHYTSPSPTPTTGRRLDTPTDEAYSMSPVRAESRQLLESPRRQLRSVCKTPYRVLDAPDLADDFYLNLVDWSSTNILGVGLGSCVYLWTAHNAAVSKLCDLSVSGDTISSVAWVQKGTTLAVGTLSGHLHIYDAPTLSIIRTYAPAHTQRIVEAETAWSITATFAKAPEGDRLGSAQGIGRKSAVCGGVERWGWALEIRAGLVSGQPLEPQVLKEGLERRVREARLLKVPEALEWVRRSLAEVTTTRCVYGISADPVVPPPSLLLSTSSGSGPGGSIGTSRRSRSNSGGDSDGDVPLWKFHEHTAAVKALAWDPHVSGVLATGGGTQDKHIRFWNTFTGTMLNELDTGSQVCNLIWSQTSHELVSTHGFSSTTAQNQICIWRYPSLSQVASLTGHTHRVLYLAMSPDGETIVTGAGDETLRFWNAFPRREGGGEKGGGVLDWGKLIR
ncbi:WD40 repeat-like protein [Boletus reticuloceps]|uniref:WD40 repeat-like protein n=1 Tax=Boletus reticuloceps TaxID=495285 RepID=A0A8I3AFX1_9AGAM|nr:WD40 repeat-like protein [Boletus reticuloceps]